MPAAEVRVMTGRPGSGFQTTRKDAEEYVKAHPEATIEELKVRPVAGATEPPPEPAPAPTPAPEPEPESEAGRATRGSPRGG
jgi:hypothetical protein